MTRREIAKYDPASKFVARQMYLSQETPTPVQKEGDPVRKADGDTRVTATKSCAVGENTYLASRILSR